MKAMRDAREQNNMYIVQACIAQAILGFSYIMLITMSSKIDKTNACKVYTWDATTPDRLA